MREDGNNSGGIAPVNFGLSADFEICGQLFEAMISKVGDDVAMRAVWKNQGQGEFGLSGLMDQFAVRLPAFFSWEIMIDQCSLSYYTRSQKAIFSLIVRDYGAARLHTYMEEYARAYEIGILLDDLSFAFSGLPVIGRIFREGDGLLLKDFGVKYVPGQTAVLYLDGSLILGGRTIELPLTYEHHMTGPSRDSVPAAEAGSETLVPGVTWFDINKSFKILTIMRIGFVLLDSKLKLCIDARFTLAVLDIEVYEMYVSLSLDGDWNFSFGISGMMVSLEKPPVSIGGGLYKAPGETLYNGKLVLRFGSYALTALGSYGETEDGTVTFFLYLMLDYPLGGSPVFYVTGLALGFALNRTLRLPGLKEVSSFPLVAAALNKPGSGLSKDTTPAAALNALGTWIRPSEGDYFVTVGVRFESFGVVKSFLLATVEFGRHLRISLLGISTVTMPPNAEAGTCPIAFAQLAVRATISPDEGIFEVMGALTAESYILDKQCRLTGGFAFCMWTKGDYKGDFLITLGGCHHPLFHNIHYPVLDKVGIHWVIQKGLTLTADGYFALTPNCLMAGARMELSYEDGSFRAWVRASMELLIAWKPFFYDIRISASIGVSFILIFKRVRLELGADLHIWGPEFAGLVTIHILFFDVTIRFNEQNKRVSPNLTFHEFVRDFLSGEDSGNKGVRSTSGAPLCSVFLSDGLIREIGSLSVITPGRLKITTRSKMPSSCLRVDCNGTKEEKERRVIRKSGVSLGIVPMGETSLTAEQSVRLVKLTKGGYEEAADQFEFTAEYENLSPALWGAAPPDINTPLIANALTGIGIKPKEASVSDCLPGAGMGYPMADLLGQIMISKKEVSWKKSSLPKGKDYSGGDSIQEIRRSLADNKGREGLLADLNRCFGIPAKVRFLGLGNNPELYLNAAPGLCTTGAKLVP